MATEDGKENEKELVVVETDPNETEIAKVDDTDASKEENKADEEKNKKPGEAAAVDEDDDDEGAEESGDARASSEAEAQGADEAKKKKDRESSAERRARQREARERLERELSFYQQRNAQLEKRQSAIELRQAHAEKLTVQQAIEQVEAQLQEAKRIEAEAIKEADGASAVEARDIADALVEKRARLIAARNKIERQPSQQQDTTPPPAMLAAIDWIKANKDWYDPKGGNEDSIIASAIEDALFREGRFNPETQAFWNELNRRLAARGIGRKQKVDDEDDNDDNEASHDTHRSVNSKSAGERKDARTKNSGGPKVSVNGSNRALKANEVYISPDRKAAMIEMGAWDDPVLRQKLLKDYQRYDREAAQGKR